MAQKNKIDYQKIYFNPKELWAITSALGGLLEDLKACDELEWNEEAQRMRKEIKLHAIKAAEKIEILTGMKSELPKFEDGDEKKFINQN